MPPLAAFAVGFVLYLVLAKIGLQSKTLEMPLENNNGRRSASPAGERFPLPGEADYGQEMARLQALADQARREDQEVVVVMGVGFVGAVMAAIIADTRRQEDRQAQQVRHRLPASQPAKLLEDPAA